MYTHISLSLQKNKSFTILFLSFCFALLSIYPIYRNFYYSLGAQTYERHRAFIEKRSEYYNPWQYRILCPYTIEAILFIYNGTIDKVYPIEEKFHFSFDNTTEIGPETEQFKRLLQIPEASKYMLIFIFFRFAENLLIFYLSFKLWNFFVKNTWLIFLGINFLALSLGNAVTNADLSFNTYMDIIFYLLTANIIVYNKSPIQLLPVVLLAAFNRETSLLIPALFFISKMNLKKSDTFKFRDIILPPFKTWLYIFSLYVIFLFIFFSLRIYFGYKPQQVWKAEAGWPMLSLNLFSSIGVRGYMELIGIQGVIPLFILYKFIDFPYLLKKWFLFIVPIWFFVHYLSVVAYESRIFLVPLTIIFLPMFLWRIEKEFTTIKGLSSPNS